MVTVNRKTIFVCDDFSIDRPVLMGRLSDLMVLSLRRI